MSKKLEHLSDFNYPTYHDFSSNQFSRTPTENWNFRFSQSFPCPHYEWKDMLIGKIRSVERKKRYPKLEIKIPETSKKLSTFSLFLQP